jgi:hypothetical protein
MWGKAWVTGKERKVLALIKSLIYAKVEKNELGRAMKDRSK